MLNLLEVNMSKDKYIKNLKPGDLIAFNNNSSKIYSAMVVSKNGSKVICISKHGTIYHILTNNIVWVKGNRWPKFVMEGFKIKENNNECN